MDKIDRLLMKVGMPARVKGYQYSKVALELLKKDPEYIEMLTKGLYPAVGKVCDTTGACVERAIRHGVEIAFDRMPPELQEELFGNTVHAMRGKPTNGEFLACLALHLQTTEEDKV